jgi:hypothetical protein
MSYQGTPPGVTTAAKLLLPFEAGSLSDWTANGNDATKVGAPTFGDGPHGAGVTLASASDYLTVADAASINISSDLTVACSLRIDALGSISTVLDRTSTANAWRLQVTAAGALQFTIWDSGGTPDTLTSSMTIVAGRTYDVEAGVEFNGTDYLFIKVEGEIWARKTTSRADVESLSLGVLTIGQRGSGSNPFVGTISNVRIEASADEDAIDDLPSNVEPERTTHGQIIAEDIDFGEELSGASWTTSGSNYWIAFSALTLSAFVKDFLDIVGVRATLTAGGSEVNFTEVGNSGDLTTNHYLVDLVNERLWSSEDPSTYAVFVATIRYRAAEKHLRVGGKPYIPTLMTASAGERNIPYIFEPYPTGGGLEFALTTQYQDHPASFVFETASNVIWPKAPVTIRAVSKHMPFQTAPILSTGLVAEPPKITPELIKVNTYAEQSRLHNISIEGSVLNLDDFNDAREDDVGYEFPAIWGLGHREVPCPMIEKTGDLSVNGINPFFKVKVCDHPIARIFNVYDVTLGVHRNGSIANVDLENATFQVFCNPGDIIVCDVDGYGTPSTATSTANELLSEFGDADDCISEPVDMLKEQLTLYANIPAANMTDASFTNTDGRVKIRRRFVEALPEKGALAGELQRALPEMLAFLFWKADGTLGLRDVRKADSVDATLNDFDVVSEEWIVNTESLAKRAEASAYTYRGTTQGKIKKGASATLTLTADAKYDVQEVFYPPPSSSGKDLTRIAHKGSLTTWLGIVRKFVEEPSVFYRAKVSADFATLELMDVVDVLVSSRPSGVGSRFRVKRIRPEADGTVAVELFSEDLFPADGTSAAAIRTAFGPIRHTEYGVSAGQNIPNAVGWQRVGDHASVFQGSLSDSSSITNRWVIRAQRVGGAADSDLQLRLRDIDNNVTVASVAGVSTSAEFVATTSFTRPSTDVRLEVQAITTNGASGTLWSAVWGAKEVSAPVGDPVPPTTLWQTGSAAGFSCPPRGRAGWSPLWHLKTADASGLALADTSGAWAVVNDHQTIFDGTIKSISALATNHFTVRSQRIGGGADTDLQFRIRDITNSQTIGTISGVGTTAAFDGGSFTPANVPSAAARIRLEYKTDNSATGTFWAGAWTMDSEQPPSTADVCATTLWETGSSTGLTSSTDTNTVPYVLAGQRPGILSYDGLQVQWMANYLENYPPLDPENTYRLRFSFYADPGTSTTFQVILAHYFWIYGSPFFLSTQDYQDVITVDVPTAGFYSVEIPPTTRFDGTGGVDNKFPATDSPSNFDQWMIHFATDSTDTVTLYAAVIDMQPPADAFGASPKFWNVDGARAGGNAIGEAFGGIPIGTRLRGAIYHDSSSSTNFNPRIVNEFNQVVLDFGAVSSTSGILTSEAVVTAPFFVKTLRLAYSNDAGTTTVESVSLDAIFPELED